MDDLSKGEADSNTVSSSEKTHLASVEPVNGSGIIESHSFDSPSQFFDLRGKTVSSEELQNAIRAVFEDVMKSFQRDFSREGPGLLYKYNEIYESLQDAANSLEKELWFHNLEAHQVIQFLRDRLSGKKQNVYMRYIEVQAIERFVKIFNPSPSEVLEIVDILKEVIASKESNSHVRVAAMEVTTELMDQYIFPNQEQLDQERLEEVVLQLIYRLERNLFRVSIYVRKYAGQMMIHLLSQSLVPEPAKQTIILRVARQVKGLTWKRKLTALEFLHNFVSLGILSDPEGGRQVALVVVDEMDDEHGAIQRQSFKILNDFLSKGILSDKVQSEVSQKTAELIFHEDPIIGNRAAKFTKNFFRGDFPIPEKLEVVGVIMEKLPKAAHGKKKALKALRIAARNGVPLSFDWLDVVVDIVSEPPPLGAEAERSIGIFLRYSSHLSGEERLIISFEKEQQKSNREILAELSPEARRSVKEILKNTDIPYGEKLEISVDELVEQASFEDSVPLPQEDRSEACYRAITTIIIE